MKRTDQIRSAAGAHQGFFAGVDRRAFLQATVASSVLLTPTNSAASSTRRRLEMPAPVEAGSGSPSGASGFSPARLRRMHEVLAGHVERGAVPGLVSLISRRDEVHVEAIGVQTFDGNRPMSRDSIFRIASVTKPITAAAMMILVEECRLRLDDPVDRWLPELADRRVLRSIEGPLDDTVPADRPITVRDLLTFRLGIGAVMVFPSRYPIQRAMEELEIAPSEELPRHPPDEMMRRYGSIPLLHQPGERWLYHTGSDLQGVLIARVTGQTLETFLRERIFDPLGMKDTAFHVQASALGRLVTSYRADPESGELTVFDEAAGGRFARLPAFEAGGGGLVSTVDDLHAFARMMLGGGKLGQVRILSRPSVELMTADHITAEQKALSPFFPGFWETHGWGFGMAVLTRRQEIAGTYGRYGWDGGYGSSWYVDPAEDTIGILLAQRLWDSEFLAVQHDFWTSVYQAIDD
jgi:CubicO group peptidase (beta-lactamase class C family)